jgi:hypothetical protein
MALGLQVRGVYNNCFPLTTFRRFLLDQFLEYFSFLTYYGLILIGILFIAAIVSLVTFHIFDHFLNFENERPYLYLRILIGFASFGVSFMLILLIVIAITEIYNADYLQWKKNQQTKKELIDPESLNEIEESRWQKLILTVFPYATARRYFIIRFSYLMAIFIFGTAYIYFSTKIVVFFTGLDTYTYLNKNTGLRETIPIWAVALISTFIITVIITGISILFNIFFDKCSMSWKKYQQRMESARDHK